MEFLADFEPEWAIDFIKALEKSPMNKLDTSAGKAEALSDERQVIERQENCTLASVRRVAAMLDMDPDQFLEGDPLPIGWHFLLLGADTRRSSLRADGFPGLGVPIPDLGLPRLMLGGRSVAFAHSIPIGAAVARTSSVSSIVRKQRASGDMAIVTLSHELSTANGDHPAIVETQTYILLPARTDSAAATTASQPAEVKARYLKTVVPDETSLFQFSALGFNSHRIHLDRDHAQRVEGFPDLVVNGGLSTLLLTEFYRETVAVAPKSFKVKHLAPMYCNRPITLAANQITGGWSLQAFDEQQQLTVDMEVITQ